MGIKIFPYGRVPEKVKGEIIALQNIEWSNCRWGDTPNIVACICYSKNDDVVGSLSIVRKELNWDGQTYIVSGISEMIIHPDYRRKGIGFQLIKAACTYIKESECDFSIFTCKKELVPFYTLGGWEEYEDVVVLGGSMDKIMSSKAMNLHTMIAFFSEKSLKDGIKSGEIFLNLGEGKMW